ncbi:MAG TPA: DUF2391 family protein [Alphaproteobacteria bacterium]|nr:DUF2391 family protein [Alphaproteobacteria bacterium]
MKSIQDHIKRELDAVKFETDLIHHDVEKIKDKFVDHTPEHFSKQDFIRSAIGAIFVGFSVIFASNTVNLVLKIPDIHYYIIIFSTIVLLTAEIYTIGYSRVTDKTTRKFGQFWLKRISTFYFTAIVVASLLAFIFGLQYILPDVEHFIKLIILISAPCSIGASFGDLIKRY